MENITEQFNAVALEYDWVTTLLEGKPDYLLDNLPDRRVSALDIGCGGAEFKRRLKSVKEPFRRS